MTKTFVLSMHRCGTRSVSEFLDAHGFRVRHCPKMFDGVDHQNIVRLRENDLDFVARWLKRIFDEYEVISDVPVPVIYRQLMEMYPEARFILVIRPAADWVKSVRRHCGGREFKPFERCQYWAYVKGRPDSIDAISDAALGRAFHKHTEAVVREIPRERLGVFHLYAGDLGDRILRFMGASYGAEFPHVNGGGE